MGRIVALDYGRKRIGFAVSDELKITARPLDVLVRTGSSDVRDVIEKCHEQDAEVIVVGLPRRTDGTEGPEAKAVRKFVAAMENKTDVPIELWDEWFTTAEAERSLIESGMRREKRRDVIDAVAASLILESWLSAHREDPDQDESDEEAIES